MWSTSQGVSHKASITLDLLRRFPDAPSRQLARILVRDSPVHFLSTDAARASIRYYRGQQGARNRTKVSTIIPRSEESVMASKTFKHLPEGLKELSDAKPLVLKDDKVLVLSDIHVPYHDKPALTMALEEGIKQGVTAIILNGDFLDCYAISSYDRSPDMPSIREEFETGKEVLSVIREAFPDASIFWKEGNHEARWDKFLQRKAPELLGLPQFSWAQLMDLGSYSIQWVPTHQYFVVGGLTIWHGHEFKGSGGVNPARWLSLRTGGMNSLCGHFHRHSVHGGKDAAGQHHGAFSTGCLCDLRPVYSPINQWVHGFAIVERFDKSHYDVQNYKIIDGRMVR
jgi:predicted phosphodiesterase